MAKYIEGHLLWDIRCFWLYLKEDGETAYLTHMYNDERKWRTYCMLRRYDTEVLSLHGITAIYMKNNRKVTRLACMISAVIYQEALNNDHFNNLSNALRNISFHFIFSIIKPQTILINTFSTYSRNNSVALC